MKNCLLLLFLFVTVNSAFSQLAIINDKDGYVNIRETNSAKSEIMGSVSDGAIFYIQDPSDGVDDKVKWWLARYFDNLDKYNRSIICGDNSHYYEGYMHISRFIYIDDLPVIPRQYYHWRCFKRVCDTLIVDYKNIHFQMAVGPFSLEGHKVEKDEYGHIKTIDGHFCNGIYSLDPDWEIKSMYLTINGKIVGFPKQMYNDLYQVNIAKAKLHYDSKGRLYINMPFNSDGCAGYDVAWVVDKNNVVKRYIGRM